MLELPAATAAAAPPNPAGPAAEPVHRRAARYAWALLLARIYEVFPLLCSKCGGEMRIIAFGADQPVAANNRRLTPTTEPPILRIA